MLDEFGEPGEFVPPTTCFEARHFSQIYHGDTQIIVIRCTILFSILSLFSSVLSLSKKMFWALMLTLVFFVSQEIRSIVSDSSR